MMWRWWSLLLCGLLFSCNSAQLICHDGHTSTYEYKNEVKLWGEVQQKFEVSCSVDVDCNGNSTLSTEAEPAFDFIAHFIDLKVKETNIRPQDALKLCQTSRNANSICALDNPPEEDSERDPGSHDNAGTRVVLDNGLFSLPVVFTQTSSGKILRIQFMEKDLENVDVVKMKRGIISALQTQINANAEEEEVDAIGRHKVRCNTSTSGDETVIDKEFNTKDDVDSPVGLQPANVHVKTRTTVTHGDITSVEGEASSQPETGADDIPPDVASGIDAGDVLKSASKYKLSLKLKQKRSTQRVKRMASFKPTEFIDSSITMETTQHLQDRLVNRLGLLYKRLQMTSLNTLLDIFIQSKDEGNLDLLKEIVALEAKIGYDNVKVKLRRTTPPLMNTLVPRTYGMLAQCHLTWDICQPMLSLYAQGGGGLAEQVFQYMLSEESHLTKEQVLHVIDTMSILVNPSDDFVQVLIHLYESEPARSEEARSLLLVMGTLAGLDSVSDSVKSILRGILLTQLDDIKEGNCPEDTDHIDALEAAGNMADEKLLPRVLEIGSICETSGTLRIAVAHAARGFAGKPETVDYFIQILESADCEVVEEVIHLLMDTMANQKFEKNLSEWPLIGLNDFDRTLFHLLTQTDNLSCIHNTAKRYFKKKYQTDVELLLEKLQMNDMFSPSQTNNTDRILKRDVEHSTCSRWSDYSGRYSDIQSSSTFQSDVRTYNRRRHCLAHFRIGGSKASADLYGGFFAGCDTSSSRAKLFARGVAEGTIFSNTYTIGTAYAYFLNEYRRISARFYVNVAGRTLVSTDTRVPDSRSTRLFSGSLAIRLYSIQLYITSIDIVVRITPSLDLGYKLISCEESTTCLELTPKARARAAAGASISLAVIQGGADIGFNLNYYLKAETRVYSSCSWPCVSLSHGHDRNSISIEFWYQLRTKIRLNLWPPWKIRFEWGWGNREVFSPSSLSWSIGSSREHIIGSYCPA